MYIPHIIKVDTPKSGPGYSNQEWPFNEPIPEGYAVIPEDMFPPENYPFGNAEVEEIDGVLTVVSWTLLEAPEEIVSTRKTYKDITSETINEI